MNAISVISNEHGGHGKKCVVMCVSYLSSNTTELSQFNLITSELFSLPNFNLCNSKTPTLSRLLKFVRNGWSTERERGRERGKYRGKG